MPLFHLQRVHIQGPCMKYTCTSIYTRADGISIALTWFNVNTMTLESSNGRVVHIWPTAPSQSHIRLNWMTTGWRVSSCLGHVPSLSNTFCLLNVSLISIFYLPMHSPSPNTTCFLRRIWTSKHTTTRARVQLLLIMAHNDRALSMC